MYIFNHSFSDYFTLQIVLYTFPSKKLILYLNEVNMFSILRSRLLAWGLHDKWKHQCKMQHIKYRAAFKSNFIEIIITLQISWYELEIT